MYKFDDLISLMARLRDPETGCPWDIKQSYQSVVPYTIEETYEVVDAIQREDYENLREELGDFMFQAVFYAQIATEESRFSMDQVVHDVVAKLIRRHPHVFPDGTLDSRRPAEADIESINIGATWDAIKAQEKTAEQRRRFLDDVPRALPALQRALKLQKKASKVGFDWNDVAPVIAKVREELEEVEDAIEHGDRKEIESEIGDVLFAAVNLARLAGVDPESALSSSNLKFETRFDYVESTLTQSGRNLTDATLQEMDELWNQAKGVNNNNSLKR
jgi:ATP diphosphatase